MRTRRLLAALVTPVVVVACATGSAPLGGGSASDAGSSGLDASYGADDAGASDGSTNKDSGITRIDSGGGGGADSGGGGGGGAGDCDISGFNTFAYDTECEALGPDGPCTPGGTDCDSLGDCCYNDPGSSCFSDFGGAQCVAP